MQNHLSPALSRGIASRTLRVTATLGLAAGVWLAVTPAQGAVVPNFFTRSCTFTDSNCSPYAQTNPPFNSSVPTECQTKAFLGAAGGTYTLPAGQRCPNNSRV